MGKITPYLVIVELAWEIIISIIILLKKKSYKEALK